MTSAEFRAFRESLLWTQAETAKKLGLTVGQISAIENGRSKVTKTVSILMHAYRDGLVGHWRFRFETPAVDSAHK